MSSLEKNLNAALHNPQQAGDAWSDWLLRKRHGGEHQHLADIIAQVNEYRDRVLDGARLSPDDTLLDVGAGKGLIGLGASRRFHAGASSTAY